MKLLLRRKEYGAEATIGTLAIDGVHECWTLEDVVRPAGAAKVPGRTAIPAGKYHVVLSWSPKFKQRMPLLVGVPNFAGIRIHAGNTHQDTEGCILVGRERLATRLARSAEAYIRLMEKLLRAPPGDLEIEIINEEPSHAA